MPELLSTARVFTTDELRRLDQSTPFSVAAWAEKSNFIRPPGLDDRRIKDIATFHALSKIHLARGRLQAFREAADRNYDLHRLYEGPLLQGHSPKEIGARAAGQLAVAKLLTTWYGLQSRDFSYMAGRQDILLAIVAGVEGVQETVCSRPQTLGMCSFNSGDVFVETQQEVEYLMDERGAGALAPYMVFPEYPIPGLSRSW